MILKIPSEIEIKEINDNYSFCKIIYFILSGHEIHSEKEAVLIFIHLVKLFSYYVFHSK